MLFNRFLCLLLLLISAAVPIFSYASSSELTNGYSVSMLTSKDGFVSYEIYSIIEDNQGLLWFGTGENGVMRYDGRKVSLLEFDSLNSNSVSHNDAGNLMLDRNGNIWIGTWGGGADLYQPTTGKFQHFTHDPRRINSLSSNRIQSLLHDQEGAIWFGSYDRGLSRYLGNNNFENVQKNNQLSSSLSHNRIWDMIDNDTNSLWIATSFGLNLYDKKKSTSVHFFPAPNNKTPTGANQIRNILKVSQNKLYLGTQQGSFTFAINSEVFTPITTVKGELIGQVNSMIADHQGHIWFVTSKGLFRQEKSSTYVEKFVLKYDHDLRIIFEDSSNNLWVTSENNGVYKIIPYRKFKSIQSNALKSPNAITLDTEGDLLIVSADTQLFKWRVATQTLETLSAPIFSAKNQVLDRPIILQDGKETLWVAQGDGLAKVNLKTKQVSFITYPTSTPNYQQFRELRALNKDRNGNLWIGTYKNGIYRYNPITDTFTHLYRDAGLSHPEVWDIFKDNQDNIWVGTGDGLNLWQEANQQFFSFKNDANKTDGLLGRAIQDIYQSRDGKLWIATQKGLNLYLPASKTFQHFDKRDGLPTSLIRAIQDDNSGHLWLTTNKGISKLDPSSRKVTNFDRYNGLLGINYYPNSFIRANNETLFTSSQRGIEFFNTTTIAENNSEFKVVLTGFNKMGQAIKLETPYTYVKDIQLSYLDYFFSFEFSVLDYIAPNKNLYAYKLEGYDDNWINIGNQNIVSFTNLDGGDYKFLVKATNSSGKWGEQQLLSINLSVSYPPWKTWWAYSFYLLASLSIILALISSRTRSQQREITRQKKFVVTLEQQVTEKTTSLNTQAVELMAVNEQLKVLTYQDGLTGLYNRRYFDKNLIIEINRHERQKQPLSLIIADIDHFKLFNDFYGHQEGDNCLRQVTECIMTNVARITDVNCRYGGEEFAIILPYTSVKQSTIVAERLCSAIEKMKIPHQTSENSPFVTLTLGVVTIPPGEKTSVEAIILSADNALYAGKSEGRNRVSRAK